MTNRVLRTAAIRCITGKVDQDPTRPEPRLVNLYAIRHYPNYTQGPIHNTNLRGNQAEPWRRSQVLYGWESDTRDTSGWNRSQISSLLLPYMHIHTKIKLTITESNLANQT